MKILIDECTPQVVKTRLPHLQVTSVQEMGWRGIRNGELLGRAEAVFDVLVTTDRNLRYQQNLKGRRLAVIVLPSNRVPVVVRLLKVIERAIMSIGPGEWVELAPPEEG